MIVMEGRDDGHAQVLRSTGARAASGAGILLVVASGVVLLLLSYFARTWESFADAVDVCPRQFCDFLDYYYPMGEAVFRAGLPVYGFLYSPFVAILLAVFPLLGLNPSLVLWGVLQVLSVSLYVLLFRRLVPARQSIQLLFVGLTVTLYPAVLNIMAGQVSVFIIAAILGMLVVNARRHRAAAAGLLALAVGFKFYPIIFVVPFVARGDTRFLLFAAAACGGFLFVIPAVLLGAGDTMVFYGALLDAFRDSGWVVDNPHSQFFPHVVLRMLGPMGLDASPHLWLLRGISYGVALANTGLVFLVQRARVRHADLWSFQLVFLTIPFVLKTSWPHDFVFLSFTQAFMAWWLLDGEEEAWTDHTVGKRFRVRRQGLRGRAVVGLSLGLSIVFSNSVFFALVGSFPLYGFCAFLFWADLLLLIASYTILLPPALRMFSRTAAEDLEREVVRSSAAE